MNRLPALTRPIRGDVVETKLRDSPRPDQFAVDPAITYNDPYIFQSSTDGSKEAVRAHISSPLLQDYSLKYLGFPVIV